MKQLSRIWSIDEKHVYAMGSKLRNVSAESFRVLSEVFATDGLDVFYIEGRIKGVDAETFEACDSGIYCNGPGFNTISHKGYGRDKNSVWFCNSASGKPCIVKRANRDTFVSIDGAYGRDHKNVFRERYALNGADAKTWHKLSKHFSKDREKVFYLSRIIKEADPQSFMTLWPNNSFWAKDKLNFYYQDQISTKEAYFKDYREYHQEMLDSEKVLQDRL
ncbi:DKNYY domain-containing protein [Cerasicoccus frondis]|uniref:DKNYY domain-containing protein n=1 Tax=Cerasicoccus frondis TaxID=490090 RepID=UPI002852C379|nr:DKNYY domain-containing protein [Cerasicoccus frondis]